METPNLIPFASTTAPLGRCRVGARIGDTTYRCSRNHGHKGHHIGPMLRWMDGQHQEVKFGVMQNPEIQK